MEKRWIRVGESLGNFAGRIPSHCSRPQDRPPECGQDHSSITDIDQSPVCATIITQPVVFYTPLPLPGANKSRDGRFSHFGGAIRFH